MKMKILITAGGTREYIDPVRFISNASSGRTGYALAEAASQKGHEVILITAPTELTRPKGIETVEAVTSRQMFEAVKEHFPRCGCLIMAAAVSDYRPVDVKNRKIKKSGEKMTIELEPTEDILKWAGNNKNTGQFVVGFALEDDNIFANAETKMKEKNLDMIIANSTDAIGGGRSELYIKTANSDWLTLKNADKKQNAAEVIKLIEVLISRTDTAR